MSRIKIFIHKKRLIKQKTVEFKTPTKKVNIYNTSISQNKDSLCVS